MPIEVDEVLGLRAAYERQRASTGRTLVGRVITVEQIADAVRAFLAIADGTPWEEAPFPVPLSGGQQPLAVAFDIRAYYEEAALAMAAHVPAARGPEDWFYGHTATGALLRRAQDRMRESGVPQPIWNPIVPTRQRQTS